MGPLALNDEVAIDLSYKILKATVADLGEKAVDPRHMQLVTGLVEREGRLGRKNSKGFYDYPRSRPRSRSGRALGNSTRRRRPMMSTSTC